MYELVNASEEIRTDFGQFGLNEGILTTFEYKKDTEKNYEALVVGVTIGATEITQRYFKPAKFFGKNQKELKPGDAEYEAAKIAADRTISAILCHYARVFISQEELENLFKLGVIKDFESFVQVIETSIKRIPNWNQKPVHVFLQYQAKPNDQGKVYLEIPKNLKQGMFIVPKLEGEWKEDKTDSHLRYIKTNPDGTTVEHPISRGSWFVKSTLAKPLNMPETKSETEPTLPAEINWGV